MCVFALVSCACTLRFWFQCVHVKLWMHTKTVSMSTQMFCVSVHVHVCVCGFRWQCISQWKKKSASLQSNQLIPDWILLIYWMANRRMSGCGPRAYTDLHAHTHTYTLTHIHKHACMHASSHTQTYNSSFPGQYELLSLIEYKRHFFKLPLQLSHMKSRIWNQTTRAFQNFLGTD